jgi:hypothetical protein
MLAGQKRDRIIVRKLITVGRTYLFQDVDSHNAIWSIEDNSLSAWSYGIRSGAVNRQSESANRG